MPIERGSCLHSSSARGSTSSTPSPACWPRTTTATLVDRIKADDFTYRAGRLTVHLAREFGFCYGVDRAVDYAYQTRRALPRPPGLPDRRDHPQPARQRASCGRMGIRFLSDDGRVARRARPERRRHPARPSASRSAMLQQLERRGCTLVDTTCGSVLNVWKNVRRYAEDGFTSVIHGKVWHEETQATASQAVQYGGRYLVVLDRRRGRRWSATTSAAAAIARPFLADVRQRRVARLRPRPRSAAHRPRQPDDDADVGVARDRRDAQGGDARPATARPTLAARFQRVRHDLQRHPGPAGRGRRACCDEQPIDLMLVIGGYNSSNTVQPGAHLRRIAPDVPHRRPRLPRLARRRSAIGRSAPRRRRRPRGGCLEPGR